jgi:hypothetical protein
MGISKIITLIIWAVCLWVLTIDSSGIWVVTGKAVFWVLLATHFLEFFIYWPKLKKMNGSLAVHFINVMLFGIIYWNEIKPDE